MVREEIARARALDPTANEITENGSESGAPGFLPT
jgi:hypothetical protein